MWIVVQEPEVDGGYWFPVGLFPFEYDAIDYADEQGWHSFVFYFPESD